MNYIAHCDGEREQSILEHLQGTAEKAKDFAEVFEKGDWGYCCGMLHDIGKYSDKFQRRIRGEEIKVDHATAGARVCMELGGCIRFWRCVLRDIMLAYPIMASAQIQEIHLLHLEEERRK